MGEYVLLDPPEIGDLDTAFQLSITLDLTVNTEGDGKLVFMPVYPGASQGEFRLYKGLGNWKGQMVAVELFITDEGTARVIF